MKKFVTAMVLVGVSSLVWTAQANGRFPSAGHVEVDPADPDHIVLRATYGLVVTHDGGRRWEWVCEKAMSYSGIWDPPIGIMTGGAVLVGLPDGLSVSTPDACSFSRIPLLEGKLVADVAVDKKNPSRAVVLTSLPLGKTFDTRLYLTEDAGGSFVQVGDVLPQDFHGLTVDLSPSDANVVYVSGVLDGPLPQGVVLRSSNGGATYDTSMVPMSDDMHGPFIGAVDPQHAERVWVRLDGTPGRLFVSEDGAQSWQEIFTGEGMLLGFSVSPDGKTLVVGGEKDGVWRSPIGTWAFERTSLLHARCLRWVDAGIYACAEQVLDGYAVGFSVTEGSTFKELTRVSDLCGPVACPKPTCTADWPLLRDTIGATSCNESTVSSSSSGGNGGMGGAGGAGVVPSTANGCGCRFGGEAQYGFAGIFLGLLTLGTRWRKRR